MNLAELIIYSLFGVLLLVIIAITWFVFRKRKKWALVITAVLLIGYIGYYAYYPVLKTSQHAEKYEMITEYLADNYPEREFTVEPDHFEAGVDVGTFNINDEDTPDMGVTLHVDDDGQVLQISNWISSDFPKQGDLWRELKFYYGGKYTLDSEEFDITKQDEWIEGELTVFALDIDGRPAIAIYDYSEAAYRLLDLQESEQKDFVSAEAEGHVFVYIDESYTEETVEVPLQNGEIISISSADNKGKLFIEE